MPKRIIEFEGKSSTDSTRISQWPTLNQLQEDYIKKVMAHVDGNKSRAADILGITRRTLYRWLEGKGDRDDT